jgi:hypothetical protein
MTADHFEATFVLSTAPATSWSRLTEHPVQPEGGHDRYWLPGFDAETTVVEQQEGTRLVVTKDQEPCAGTEIVVTLEADEAGTRITVVQSRFGDWLPAMYDTMAVGWRHIVADLETYLGTGVHARRHLRPWGDLGAVARSEGGGLRVQDVRADGLAGRLGLRDDDLLVVLGGAPVANQDDLLTVLRVLEARPGPVAAEWVRDGALLTAVAESG